MASNLAISVRADTGEARAQLALVQSDVRSLGRSLSQAANDARNSDLGGVVTDQMRQLAGQLEAAKAEMAKLKAELSKGHGLFSSLNEGIKAPLEDLAMLKSSLRETAELAGAVFVVDKAREFINAMGELGERTVNMAAAVGMTPHEFSALTGALQLAGAETENANRIIERLGKNLQLALTQPSSEAAKAVGSLGISHEQLAHAATDTNYAIALLFDKFAELNDSEVKSADYTALMGRGWDSMTGAMRRGSQGFEELKKEAEDLGIVLSDKDARSLAETEESVHKLSATIRGEGIRAFLAWDEQINSSIGNMQRFIVGVGGMISAIGSWFSAAGQNSALVNPGAYADKALAAQRAALGLPPAPAAAASADQDFSGGTSKPSAQPWPTSGRGRSAGGKDDSYEIFAANERLKIQEAKGDADQIQAIYAEWLAEVARIYGQDSTKYLDLEREKVAAAQRSAEEKIRAAQQAAAEETRVIDAALRIQQQEYNKAAEEAAKAWKDATKQISDQLATLAVDVLDHTKTMGQAFASLAQGIAKDFIKSTLSSVLGGSGGSGGGLSSLLFGEGGLGGAIGLGSGGLLGMLGGALGLGGVNQDFWGGISGTGEAIAGGSAAASGGGGGLLGLLLGFLPKFAKGGIVPSAAGGWAVPQVGSGGVLAQLHSNEMVLPANVSGAVMNMANGGGGAGTVNFNVSALDGQSAAAFFRQNGAMLAQALNRAWRNGAPFAAPG